MDWSLLASFHTNDDKAGDVEAERQTIILNFKNRKNNEPNR
jgi:hypothetical protein